MQPQDCKVIGVGSPIVDLIARVNDDFIEFAGGEKGGRQLVEPAHMEQLVKSIDSPMTQQLGGAAANTIFALAHMHMQTAFLGEVGNDEPGRFFKQAFEEIGGDASRFKISDTLPTARCLSLITPDTERTMRTNLGASVALYKETIVPEDFAGYTHVYLEGYSLIDMDHTRNVMSAAKEAGCFTALDMGCIEVVENARAELPELLENYVDAVFANEDEARAFCGRKDPFGALDELSELCSIVAVKLGSLGTLLRRDAETFRVKPNWVKNVVDTTGAGDFWAAGFLFGLIREYDLDVCGQLGNLLGGEVVQHMGANLSDAGWQRVRDEICRLDKTPRHPVGLLPTSVKTFVSSA